MKNSFDCKDEKITEKAFTHSLVVSVLSILLCIVALCSMTYAWFSESTTTESNTLASGCFDITVNIEADDTSTANEAVVFSGGKYTLTKAGKYTVKIEPSHEATVKGYCIVTIDNDLYSTNVILDEDMTDDIYTSKTSPLTFTIVTEKDNTVVELKPHWGVPVDHKIKEKSTVTVKESQIEIKNENVTN